MAGAVRTSMLVGLVLCAGLFDRALSQDSAADPAQLSILAPLSRESLLLAADDVDGLAVVVGERGHVLLSENQGRSWRQVQVPSRATLTGVHFHDRSLGWAVGHDATILRTRDGGNTWERVYYDPEDEIPLLDVWFEDADNGFAFGAYGLFLVTSDGGTSWEPRTISEYDDSHLHQIVRSETGRLYMPAERGTIYRSDDGGETWTSLPSPYEGSFFGALPLEGDAVLVFGLRGHVFRSENAGERWERIETGTVAMINRGIRSFDGAVILVGHKGTVLSSRDEGRSFTLYELPDRQAFAAVIQTEDGGLILAGEFGVTRFDGLEAVAEAAVDH